MKIKSLFLSIALVVALNATAQVPKLGNDSLLDICTWNVEWLGSTSGGPTNEALQYANVKELITKTGFDVVALQEMSYNTTFDNLLGDLSATYDGINSTFSATQKMAFIYKKSMFTPIVAECKNILTQYASGAFATRPPLQVVLQTKGGNITDTLYFIIVHFKAHTGNDTEKADSYNKRIQAAGYVQTYIEQTLAGKKVIILGDWNDDLQFSIHNNMPTPFKPQLDAGYFFPTKQLTDAGYSSYAFGGKMIDHIMVNKTIEPFYITASSRVFNNAGSYISNYSNTTSDHYPVYAFFNWKKLTYNPPLPNNVNEIAGVETTIYPNPATEFININGEYTSLSIFDILGSEQLKVSTQQPTIDISMLDAGVYFVKINTQKGSTIQKLVVQQ